MNQPEADVLRARYPDSPEESPEKWQTRRPAPVSTATRRWWSGRQIRAVAAAAVEVGGEEAARDRPWHRRQMELPVESRLSDAVAPVTQAAAGISTVASSVPKGSVILAIGLAWVGKEFVVQAPQDHSTFQRHVAGLLFDDPTEQRFQDLIFSNLRSMLKARLIARRPLNYVDATNLTPHERQSWVKLGT